MKQLTVKSGDGVIFNLDIPEIFDCFPEEFRSAAGKMNRADCRLLAKALRNFMLPQEEEETESFPSPSPEEIADAARRGLTAMERITRG